MKISPPLPTPADYEAQPDAAHPAAPAPARAARPLRRMIYIALRVVVVLLAVVVGYKLTRVALHGWNAYEAARTVAALRDDGDIDRADLVQAAAAAEVITQSAAGIESEARLFAPLLRAAEPLPWIGPTLAAMPNFLAAGRIGAEMGQALLHLTTAQADRTNDAEIPLLLAAALRDQPQAFVALGQQAAAIEQLLGDLPPAALIAPLDILIPQAQAGARLLSAGLEMAPALPTLLGFERPQAYLILVQNNQELRATGGFISAVGTLTLAQGQPSGLEFVDSYAIARNDVDHPWAPDPLKQYMGIELIFLRDANWSPDFPTTAQLARSLYAQDAGAQVDGVVSIDLRAVELLIGALAPLTVPGADEPVTGENLIAQLQRFWDQPLGTDATIQNAGSEWLKSRKDFMPVLAKAALDRIERGNFNPLALAAAADNALNERAIQVWTADPTAAERLATLGWDGRLRPLPGADFLALVDTNMGYNKVDAVLDRSLRYAVSWPAGPDAPALAVASITYRHPVQLADPPVCKVESEYGLTYTDMTERCYFNYVRLYVPAGSELIATDGVTEDSVADRPGERGTQLFAGYFVLEPGRQHTVSFTYRLPAALARQDYRLVVQRQSGAGPLPLQLAVDDATLTTTLVDGRLIWTPQWDALDPATPAQ
jgi:hypothetical protein